MWQHPFRHRKRLQERVGSESTCCEYRSLERRSMIPNTLSFPSKYNLFNVTRYKFQRVRAYYLHQFSSWYISPQVLWTRSVLTLAPGQCTLSTYRDGVVCAGTTQTASWLVTEISSVILPTIVYLECSRVPLIIHSPGRRHSLGDRYGSLRWLYSQCPCTCNTTWELGLHGWWSRCRYIYTFI